MPSEYDEQLLESVAVRRQRMSQALLYGEDRFRRTTPDILRRTRTGIILTSVLCAGCVGYSFAMNAIAQARQQEAERSASANPTASETPTSTPSSSPTSPFPSATPTGYLARLTALPHPISDARDAR